MKDQYIKNLEGRLKNLQEVVKQVIRPLKDVPFNVVIESLYDKKVLSFNLSDVQNKILLQNLIEIAKEAGRLVKKSGGIKSKRVNEVGNYIEPFVEMALKKVGYEILLKNTKSGKNKSVGYPDLQFKDGVNRVCHLECKTFNLKNVSTTQRSFYLSPSSDPKVNFDGFHFVMSFEIADKIGAKNYQCSAYKIVSIEDLSCDLKHEFNSDNKRLYAKEMVLAEGDFGL